MRDEAPQKILEDSQAIVNIFVSGKFFFAFLSESGGEALGKFLKFFDAGGSYREFSLTFPGLFGGSGENFFPDVVFF